MQYAYARVSAADQNLGRQIEEFLKFGIKQNRIFCDKKSGKDFERKEYTRLIKRRQPRAGGVKGRRQPRPLGVEDRQNIRPPQQGLLQELGAVAEELPRLLPAGPGGGQLPEVGADGVGAAGDALGHGQGLLAPRRRGAGGRFPFII